MSDQKTTGDSEVGYCKPPKSTQWKPGQSGNPKGRPKTTKSGQTDVAEVLDEPLTVKQAGTARQMPPFEVGVRQLVKRALHNNDLRAILEFVKLCESYGLMAPPQPLEQSGGVLEVACNFEEWGRMSKEFWPKEMARRGIELPDEHGVGPTQEEH
jgi:hypothetical protein